MVQYLSVKFTKWALLSFTYFSIIIIKCNLLLNHKTVWVHESVLSLNALQIFLYMEKYCAIIHLFLEEEKLWFKPFYVLVCISWTNQEISQKLHLFENSFGLLNSEWTFTVSLFSARLKFQCSSHSNCWKGLCHTNEQGPSEINKI